MTIGLLGRVQNSEFGFSLWTPQLSGGSGRTDRYECPSSKHGVIRRADEFGTLY